MKKVQEDIKETLLRNQQLLSELSEETAGVPNESIGKELQQEFGDMEAADIEDTAEEKEEIPKELESVQIRAAIESLLLASDKPVNLSTFREVFKGSNVNTELIRKALEELKVEYAGAERGMTLSEIGGGYQLRTKVENMVFVRRLAKGRPFKLSGPALEVLSIIAYKQPLIKGEIDSIRGVESGHLVRGLMDRALVRFVGKSEAPGKPMLYGTTRKFLEIFGLRDLRELPSISEIDDLLPDGMMDEETDTPEKNWDKIHQLSMEVRPDDTEKHAEWEKITQEIAKIETTTEFFEKEKQRQKDQENQERAEGLLEALQNGETLDARDQRWLNKYEASKAVKEEPAASQVVAPAVEESALERAVKAFEADD